jgi:hypothetical protein
MGLYRDVMGDPMTIYIDEYRKKEPASEDCFRPLTKAALRGRTQGWWSSLFSVFADVSANASLILSM